MRTPEQHANLQSSLQSFRSLFLSSLDQTCATLFSDISTWRNTVETRFQAKYTTVQDVLAGPYNKELNWDWTETGMTEDLAGCLKGMRVRLREDPSLELPVAEYFEKYARGSLSVLKTLAEAGFFTPPPNKFFLSFCRQIFAGEKTLLRACEVQRVEIPPDQVDLAFIRTQELIAREPDLQRYTPSGSPILRLDKEFYLHVVNSLYGLPYTIVPPLTTEEQETVAKVKAAIQSVEKLPLPTRAAQILSCLEKNVSGLRGVEAEEVERFWRLLEEAQAGN